MEDHFSMGQWQCFGSGNFGLPLNLNKMSAVKRLKNIHPGEVLLEEFLEPLNITAYRLSKDTVIPQTRISEIIKGNRRVTADTALRFSKYFGTTPKFWLGLQDDYDLEEGEALKGKDLNQIRHYEQATEGMEVSEKASEYKKRRKVRSLGVRSVGVRSKGGAAKGRKR
jgi:antitoxin HigA-1